MPIDWPYHALPLYIKMDYLKMKIGYSKVKGSSQSFPGTGLNMFREPGRIFQELLILFVPFMMKNHNSKIDVKVVMRKRYIMLR